MNLPETLNIAQQLSRGAGQILMEGFGGAQESVTKTSTVDLVTVYDGLAEDYITRELADAFPDHRLVGEEGTATAGDGPFVWYIDPLDGTVNYAHGFPIFAVSLGLYKGDRPQVGVVFDPTRDELFYATAGGGAFVRQGQGDPRPLKVSGATDLGQSLLATGFPYDRQHTDHDNVQQARAFLKRARGLRRPGAAALDVCYVAAGRLDGYWEYKLKIWDVAAAALILTEAGGRISHIPDGQPLRPDPVLDLVACTPGIEGEMFEVLKEAKG